MDSPETSLAKSAQAGLQAAGGLLSRLLGPAADEVGQILQDRVRAYRAKNLANVLDKTDKKIRLAGRSVAAVPAKLLLPIIEGASLEDCDELAEKWAGLLASAAVSQDAVHPSFARVLSELTSLEAALLERLNEHGGEAPSTEFFSACAESFGCEMEVVHQMYGNLDRLGLLRVVERRSSGKRVIEISPFGYSFLSAVMAPANRSS